MTISRENVGTIMGYPECINPTYGCMSAQCVIDTYNQLGFNALQRWVTFDEAFAICNKYTGVINPVGMYHYMGIRGKNVDDIWLANSAPGYLGIYDNLSRTQFNNFSPVQVIYLESRI